MTTFPKVTIRTISDVVTKGTTPTSLGRAFVSSGVRFIKVETIATDGTYLPGKVAYIDAPTNNLLRRSQLRQDDILFSIAGALGRTTIVEDSWLPANTNQAFAIIRPSKRSAVDARYLLWALRSQAIERHISEINVQAAQANLSLEQVRDFEIPLPSIETQKSITSALDDVDSLIATLKQAIAKKQAIKQGIMQELLTGRTRLPGFDDPWKQTEVSELLEFKNGLNKGSMFFGAGTPIVNFMDVINGPIITSSDLGGRVTLTRDEINRFSAKRGDLFFTRTSETVDEVGTAAVLVDDVPDACFSGFILRGRPKSRSIDSRFIAQAFQLANVRKQVTSSASYTTRALTNGRSLGRVVIYLPPFEEQRAIASVIEDADTDLLMFNSRLTKARAVKTGMMQVLLTGLSQPIQEEFKA